VPITTPKRLNPDCDKFSVIVYIINRSIRFSNQYSGLDVLQPHDLLISSRLPSRFGKGDFHSINANHWIKTRGIGLF
jgi:hypothetical protein